MAITIMIVDDSAVTRAVLKKTISMAGLPVEEILQAGNGRQALETLAEHKVDLIFADLNMPEMSGFEMAQRVLSETEPDKRPVIVVVSTEASSVRVEELKELGVMGYVHKPFTPEQIRDVLLEVMQPAAG